MARTIILSLAPVSTGGPELWSVTEDGRICNALSWDEMLGTVCRLTMTGGMSYSMQAVEDYVAQAMKRMESRAQADKAAEMDALRAAVDSAQNIF